MLSKARTLVVDRVTHLNGRVSLDQVVLCAITGVKLAAKLEYLCVASCVLGIILIKKVVLAVELREAAVTSRPYVRHD